MRKASKQKNPRGFAPKKMKILQKKSWKEGNINIIWMYYMQWAQKVILKGKLFVQKLLSTSLWGRELKCEKTISRERFERSTSLWGRELKYVCVVYRHLSGVSTSLWGRELKYHKFCGYWQSSGRPPCEVVSWNNTSIAELKEGMEVDLLVRSWVEIS